MNTNCLNFYRQNKLTKFITKYRKHYVTRMNQNIQGIKIYLQVTNTSADVYLLIAKDSYRSLCFQVFLLTITFRNPQT